MDVIGILGGVASGKSLVAGQLCDLGASVLDADKVGHEVLREPEVKALVHERWGESVFDEKGWIDRPSLAKIVFESSSDGLDNLDYLEKITHPRIGQRLRDKINTLRSEQQTDSLILDAPVMMKAGWDRFCDHILFVDSDLKQRMQRAMTRGWTEQEFQGREHAQTSVELKRQRADVVIDNRGTPEETFEQVSRFWRSLH